MNQKGSVLQKLISVLAVLCFLACPAVFISAMWFPQGLAFLEPVLCPSGTHLENPKTRYHDSRGNTVSVTLICTGDGQEVGVTGWIVALMLGPPALGVGLLWVWATLAQRRAVRQAMLELAQQQQDLPGMDGGGP